jgi:hypothetical protein
MEMIATVWGIVGSFPGVDGERSAIMARIGGKLIGVDHALGAEFRHSYTGVLGYRLLSAQTADFDTEMRKAVLELTDYLALRTAVN